MAVKDKVADKDEEEDEGEGDEDEDEDEGEGDGDGEDEDSDDEDEDDEDDPNDADYNDDEDIPENRLELCKDARLEFDNIWIQKVKRSGIYEDYMYDPICGLERLCNIDWEEEGFCKGCVRSWKNAWTKKRVKLWGDLDFWLKLPDLKATSGKKDEQA